MGSCRLIAALACAVSACAGAGDSMGGAPQFTASAEGTGAETGLATEAPPVEDDGTGPTPESCGDGVIDPGEICDGADLGGANCAVAGFDDGELACGADCTFDTSACWRCGDGGIGIGEVCDGINLGGETCESLGFGEGMLSCAADCQSIDTSECGPNCGTSPMVSPDGDCPGICDACIDDTCLITCNDAVECEDDVIQCPEDWHCDITCAGGASCRISEFNCPQNADCRISCLWTDSCELSQLHCGEGRCEVYCSDKVDACNEFTVNCGENACIATCEQDYDDAPTLNCGDACECGTC